MIKNIATEPLFCTELSQLNVSSYTECEEVKTEFCERYVWDESYIACGCNPERRKWLEWLWSNFKCYADTDFPEKIKTRFHQRTWEMYIGNVLLSKGLSVVSAKERRTPANEGPDFIIKDVSGQSMLYLECVAPTKGDEENNPDIVPEIITSTINHLECHYVPEDQIIIRTVKNAINKKMKQYRKWQKKDWFDSNIPYVIAVNIGDFRYVENRAMPYVIKSLFGLDKQYITIDPMSGQVVESGFSYRNSIPRSNGSSVPVDNFLSDKFKNLSGILWSNDNILYALDCDVGGDCSYINNPFAVNPLEDWFENNFRRWKAIRNKDSSAITLKNLTNE